MKKMLLILCMVASITACVPAALLAGAAAGATGGSIVHDKRSFKTMSQDQNAHSYAQRWINSDSMLKGRSHISVSVFNHVALIVGQAETPEIRQRAFQIVSRVKNINKIYNEVTISGPTSSMQRVSDSWISTKVRTELLAKPGISSNNLKVVTENGIVYLMGSVSRHQAALATNVARRVSGVTKVVRVFQYK